MIWIKFVSFVLVVYVISAMVKLFLRKLIKIEKEKMSIFSHNHITELHRKIDWAIRVTSMIAGIVISALITIKNYSINLLLIVSFFHIVLDSAVRVFFECNYSPNPKQYILTISDGVIFSFAIGIVIQFDLLVNLLNNLF